MRVKDDVDIDDGDAVEIVLIYKKRKEIGPAAAAPWSYLV